jgi:hypothetical protein
LREFEKDTQEIHDIENAMRVPKEDTPVTHETIPMEADAKLAIDDTEPGPDDDDWETLLTKTTNLVQDFEEATKMPFTPSEPLVEHESEAATQKLPEATFFGPTGSGKSTLLQENIFITLASRGTNTQYWRTHINSEST